MLAAASANAQRLFNTVVSSGGNTAALGVNSITDVDELFDPALLFAVLPGFNPVTDDLAGSLGLRGLPSSITWDAGGTTLTTNILGVPAIVITDGAGLASALDQLVAILSGDSQVNQNQLVTAILKGFVKYSPVDPVAGNPNSLQSRMFERDWRLGTAGPFTSGPDRLDTSAKKNLISLTPEYGYAKAGPFDFQVQLVELPIDYRFNFANSKWSILWELPITATFTEGQWSVMANTALGLEYRPTEWLSITPLVRVGGVGSLDLGALALMYSGTINAQAHQEWEGFRFGFGVMGGFAKTIDGIEISGTRLDYELTHGVVRIGGDVAGEMGELWGAALGWKMFGSTMMFFGEDELYLKRQNELGVGIERLRLIGGKRYTALGLMASALFGRDGGYTGMTARLVGHF